ncbi:hypothetical protein BCR34DRAFT_463745, partial [Clohesyomyces aquaticus]
GLPMHIFEWHQDALCGEEISNVRSVERLVDMDRPAVRIVFAPTDVPHPKTVQGMMELFDHFRIPSAFIDESLQHVSQSFCARKDEYGTQYTWFHLLTKDIAVSKDDKPRRIVHVAKNEKDQDIKKRSQPRYKAKSPTDEEVGMRAQRMSQANFNWIKPGFVLKIGQRITDLPQSQSPKIPQGPQRRGTSATIESGTTLAPEDRSVTLFCFGAPRSLADRFKKVQESASTEDLIKDPYILLEIVMEEMYKLMDGFGWEVGDIFGGVETRTLELAPTPGKAEKEMEFTGLHNLAKHAIYLRENCESALTILESLRTHHLRLMRSDPSIWEMSTQDALDYRKTMFQSTQRRLESLEKRMENILQLSFHLVTQADSRVMKLESKSMKTIAVMTLIFMPLGTIAAIFGTQMIKLRDDAPYHMIVSQDFWLLWLIAVPITIVVVVIWRVWYQEAKAQFV